MTKTIPVLDHGYIRFVEVWGRGDSGQMEAAIIEAARMSTGKGFNGWDAVQCQECGLILQAPQSHTSAPGVFCPNTQEFKDIGDKRLLAYLYNNKHAGPFEFAGMTIEVQAPIMVFREWHRHRTQSYNEMSARYIPLPDVNYVPSIQRLMIISSANKQAQSMGTALTEANAKLFQDRLEDMYGLIQVLYEMGLNLGVPKELARLPIPVARYSRMRASGNLRNWLAFLTLRMDPNAQWEIRQYANILGQQIVSQIFPRTWELFSK